METWRGCQRSAERPGSGTKFKSSEGDHLPLSRVSFPQWARLSFLQDCQWKIMKRLRMWWWWDVAPNCASLVSLSCTHGCGSPGSLAHRCMW